MALLPSGSAREDVELVVIETNACSLVIKGRPYHSKYESLHQYQKMDFHDLMQFDVKGEGIEEVRVFDVDQKATVKNSKQRPIFLRTVFTKLLSLPKTDLIFLFITSILR